MKKLVWFLAPILVAAAGYLVFWPVPIDPVAWHPAPAPELTGPFAVNELLTGVERIAAEIHAPEDTAFDDEGWLYTGSEDGVIYRLRPDGSAIESFAETGGRPLGMVFDAEGRLVVADAVRQLIRVDRTGRVETLADEVDGEPLVFADDLDIASDGTIYFSDGTTKFPYPDFIFDLLEHGGHGRLLAHDPTRGTTRVLLDGLQFANGVVLAPDESFVLVCETWGYSVRRLWLRGPREGQDEVWIDNLPGFPDNINRGSDGIYWLALASPRVPRIDRMASRPFLRELTLRLPSRFMVGPIPHGFVLGLDAEGRVVHNLQDPSGGVSDVTSVMEHEGRLYLGSNPRMGIAVAPSPSHGRRAAVEAAQRAWVEALEARSVDYLREHSLPEISMLPAAGRLMTDFDDERWQAMKRAVRTRGEERKVEHDIEEIKIYGDVAIVTGHSRVRVTHGDGTTEERARRLTYVWVWRGGEWLQTHHHVSPLSE